MRVDTLHSMTLGRLAVVGVDATLRNAALALSAPHIGLLVVCDKNGSAAGVVTKSDIVRHLAERGSPDASVAALMSLNIVSCRPADDLYAAWQTMAARSLQNLPVLGTDSKALGVLDIRDALKMLFEQEQYQERLLVNYVAGVGYQ